MTKATVILTAILLTVSVSAMEISLSAEPYLAGGVCVQPVIPAEGDDVTITLRPSVDGQPPENVPGLVTITAPGGGKRDMPVRLERDQDGALAGHVSWKAWSNGLYTVTAAIDPEDAVTEDVEDNNTAVLTLPVVVQGRRPHFPWYREVETARWTTCFAPGSRRRRCDGTQSAHPARHRHQP